jgi:acetolactate synthase small subunit
MTGTEEKHQALIDLLTPYEIKEMVKTGTVSIERGTNIISK